MSSRAAGSSSSCRCSNAARAAERQAALPLARRRRERARCVRGPAGARRRAVAARRRRLHDGRDRRRGRIRAAAAGVSRGRRGDARTGDPPLRRGFGTRCGAAVEIAVAPAASARLSGRDSTTKEATMRLQVKGKNVEITPSIREYAERKLVEAREAARRARRRSRSSSPSRRTRRSPRATSPRRTIFTKGPTLRAREASPDMKASIDQLAEKLERQVKRYRERRIVEPRRHAAHHGETSNGSTPRRRPTTTTSRCRSSAVAVRGRLPGDEPRPSGLSAEPPGWDGEPRGEPGIHGIPRARRWDAVVTGSGAGARRRHGRVRRARRRHAARRRRTSRRGRRAARRRRRAALDAAVPCRGRAAGRRDLGRRGLVDRRPRGCPASTGERARARRDRGSGRALDVDGGPSFDARAPALEAAGVRRARRRGSTATSGRSRLRRSERWARRGDRARSGAVPCCRCLGFGILREGPSLRRRAAHEAPRRAGGLHRDARARLPELSDDELRGEDGRVPRAARRTARSSRTSSSRRSPPCARRACASPTSASSTSR